MFKAVSNQVNFAELEKEMLAFWKERDIFRKSVENRRGAKEYVFYDGPPFATGLPHYGHLLAGTIKDVIPRYRTMRGDYVERNFGWDCHGLPVENEMEKELNLSNKRDIENFGIGRFNEACRSIVLRYCDEWEDIVTRMGRWVDFRNGYRTMDLSYMESIWWVFKTLWDQELIYEGYKIQPYCPRCATPLSNFEANQGYLEVVDPAITVRFRVLDEENTYFLAWTTTPWTLPSNLGLAVGPEIDYVRIKDGDSFYYLAESRIAAYYKETPEIVWRGRGRELEGRRYEPLFPYFAGYAKTHGSFKVMAADFVSTEDGTGIVHTAPGFGEDDNEVGRRHGIGEVCPIDKECFFTEEVADFAGRYVKDCDKEIISRLKEEGKLVHRGQIKHNYPHCWRCDSALIYRAFPTWFVRIDRIKEKMIRANNQINWVPAHLKHGRFGKWLENARDWNIGRNRYWGTPLPIWRNDEGEVICVGSVAELEGLVGKKVDDLHKHFMDELEIPSPTGKSPLKRVTEVLDCWFESGSMPYAQWHYPFENKERFENNFPADFIAEGQDQTRGWFYTLVVLSAALFDCPPFRNVLVNGMILAEDGQKMSKRKKNYPDPLYMVDQYGADAVRLFMLGSQVVHSEDLRFSESGVKEILRSVMIPMWNALSFFVTYANVDGYEPAGDRQPQVNNVLDRWILSSLTQMCEEIRFEMDNYNLQKAANRFVKFVDDLTNWYIRRSRRRFWKSQDDADKREAYDTLYFVLVNFAKTAAPFIPLSTEAMYQVLRREDMPESVHLCDFPVPSGGRDVELERQMELTMTAVSLGRYLRTQYNLKVRQPLGKAIIAAPDADAEALLRDAAWIITDELNVKEVEFSRDEERLVHRTAKANFKALGGRLGKNMKEAAALIAELTSAEIGELLAGGTKTLTLGDGSSFELNAADLMVQREEREGVAVATGDGVSVAFETELTPLLLAEGFAREFVSRIQNLRKELNYEVTDRIRIQFLAADAAWEQLERFADYIKEETLALELLRLDPLPEDAVELTVNDTVCRVKITRE